MASERGVGPQKKGKCRGGISGEGVGQGQAHGSGTSGLPTFTELLPFLNLPHALYLPVALRSLNLNKSLSNSVHLYLSDLVSYCVSPQPYLYVSFNCLIVHSTHKYLHAYMSLANFNFQNCNRRFLKKKLRKLSKDLILQGAESNQFPLASMK